MLIYRQLLYITAIAGYVFGSDIKLDLSSTEANQFDVAKFENGAVETTRITPKLGLEVKKIYDASNELWSPLSTDFFMKSLEIHQRSGHDDLGHLVVWKPNQDVYQASKSQTNEHKSTAFIPYIVNNLFFKRKDRVWFPLTQYHYDVLKDDMSSQDLVLNLDNFLGHNISVNYLSDKVTKYTLMPKHQTRIVKVLQRGDVLWKSETGLEVKMAHLSYDKARELVLLNLTLSSPNATYDPLDENSKRYYLDSFRYYSKMSRGSWVEVGQDEYEYQLSVLRKSAEPQDVKVQLDLSNLPASGITFSKNQYVVGGMEVTSYTTSEGFKLNLVKDGTRTLWSSTVSSVKDLYVYDLGSRQVLDLRVVKDYGLNDPNDYLFFKKESLGQWEKLSSDEYKFLLNSGKLPVVLDIDVCDYLVMFKVGYKEDGVPVLMFKPLPGYHVNKVVQSGSVVWDSTRMLSCKKALIFNYPDKSGDVTGIPCTLGSDAELSGKVFVALELDDPLEGKSKTVYYRKAVSTVYDETSGNVENAGASWVEMTEAEYEASFAALQLKMSFSLDLDTVPSSFYYEDLPSSLFRTQLVGESAKVALEGKPKSNWPAVDEVLASKGVAQSQHKDFLVSKYDYKGVKKVSVTPRFNKNLTKVVEGSEVIWEKKKGSNSLSVTFNNSPQPTLLTVSFTDSETATVNANHYYRNQGKWEQVDWTRYNDLMELMADVEDHKYFTVNLKNMKPTNKYSYNIVYDYIPYAQIYPNFGYQMRNLVEDSELIWTLNNPNGKGYENLFKAELTPYKDTKFVKLATATSDARLMMNYYVKVEDKGLSAYKADEVSKFSSSSGPSQEKKWIKVDVIKYYDMMHEFKLEYSLREEVVDLWDVYMGMERDYYKYEKTDYLGATKIGVITFNTRVENLVISVKKQKIWKVWNEKYAKEVVFFPADAPTSVGVIYDDDQDYFLWGLNHEIDPEKLRTSEPDHFVDSGAGFVKVDYEEMIRSFEKYVSPKREVVLDLGEYYDMVKEFENKDLEVKNSVLANDSVQFVDETDVEDDDDTDLEVVDKNSVHTKESHNASLLEQAGEVLRRVTEDSVSSIEKFKKAEHRIRLRSFFVWKLTEKYPYSTSDENDFKWSVWNYRGVDFVGLNLNPKVVLKMIVDKDQKVTTSKMFDSVKVYFTITDELSMLVFHRAFESKYTKMMTFTKGESKSWSLVSGVLSQSLQTLVNFVSWPLSVDLYHLLDDQDKKGYRTYKYGASQYLKHNVLLANPGYQIREVYYRSNLIYAINTSDTEYSRMGLPVELSGSDMGNQPHGRTGSRDRKHASLDNERRGSETILQVNYFPSLRPRLVHLTLSTGLGVSNKYYVVATTQDDAVTTTVKSVDIFEYSRLYEEYSRINECGLDVRAANNTDDYRVFTETVYGNEYSVVKPKMDRTLVLVTQDKKMLWEAENEKVTSVVLYPKESPKLVLIYYEEKSETAQLNDSNEVEQKVVRLKFVESVHEWKQVTEEEALETISLAKKDLRPFNLQLDVLDTVSLNNKWYHMTKNYLFGLMFTEVRPKNDADIMRVKFKKQVLFNITDTYKLIEGSSVSPDSESVSNNKDSFGDNRGYTDGNRVLNVVYGFGEDQKMVRVTYLKSFEVMDAYFVRRDEEWEEITQPEFGRYLYLLKRFTLAPAVLDVENPDPVMFETTEFVHGGDHSPSSVMVRMTPREKYHVTKVVSRVSEFVRDTDDMSSTDTLEYTNTLFASEGASVVYSEKTMTKPTLLRVYYVKKDDFLQLGKAHFVKGGLESATRKKRSKHSTAEFVESLLGVSSHLGDFYDGQQEYQQITEIDFEKLLNHAGLTTYNLDYYYRALNRTVQLHPFHTNNYKDDVQSVYNQKVNFVHPKSDLDRLMFREKLVWESTMNEQGLLLAMYPHRSPKQVMVKSLDHEKNKVMARYYAYENGKWVQKRTEESKVSHDTSAGSSANSSLSVTSRFGNTLNEPLANNFGLDKSTSRSGVNGSVNSVEVDVSDRSLDMKLNSFTFTQDDVYTTVVVPTEGTKVSGVYDDDFEIWTPRKRASTSAVVGSGESAPVVGESPAPKKGESSFADDVVIVDPADTSSTSVKCQSHKVKHSLEEEELVKLYFSPSVNPSLLVVYYRDLDGIVRVKDYEKRNLLWEESHSKFMANYINMLESSVTLNVSEMFVEEPTNEKKVKLEDEASDLMGSDDVELEIKDPASKKVNVDNLEDDLVITERLVNNLANMSLADDRTDVVVSDPAYSTAVSVATVSDNAVNGSKNTMELKANFDNNKIAQTSYSFAGFEVTTITPKGKYNFTKVYANNKDGDAELLWQSNMEKRCFLMHFAPQVDPKVVLVSYSTETSLNETKMYYADRVNGWTEESDVDYQGFLKKLLELENAFVFRLDDSMDMAGLPNENYNHEMTEISRVKFRTCTPKPNMNLVMVSDRYGHVYERKQGEHVLDVLSSPPKDPNFVLVLYTVEGEDDVKYKYFNKTVKSESSEGKLGEFNYDNMWREVGRIDFMSLLNKEAKKALSEESRLAQGTDDGVEVLDKSLNLSEVQAKLLERANSLTRTPVVKETRKEAHDRVLKKFAQSGVDVDGTVTDAVKVDGYADSSDGLAPGQTVTVQSATSTVSTEPQKQLTTLTTTEFLDQLSSYDSLETYKEFELNLSILEGTEFKTNYYLESGIFRTVLRVKNNNLVKSVKLGSQVIWEAPATVPGTPKKNNQMVVTYVYLAPTNDPKVLTLFFADNRYGISSLRFMKGTSWIRYPYLTNDPLNEKALLESTNSMVLDVKTEPLMFRNITVFKKVLLKDRDAYHMKIFMKETVKKVVKVVSGEATLWDKKENEEFKAVYLYPLSKPKFVRVDVKTPSGDRKEFYRYYSETWFLLKEKDFETSLERHYKHLTTEFLEVNLSEPDLYKRTSTFYTVYSKELFDLEFTLLAPNNSYLFSELVYKVSQRLNGHVDSTVTDDSQHTDKQLNNVDGKHGSTSEVKKLYETTVNEFMGMAGFSPKDDPKFAILTTYSSANLLQPEGGDYSYFSGDVSDLMDQHGREVNKQVYLSVSTNYFYKEGEDWFMADAHDFMERCKRFAHDNMEPETIFDVDLDNLEFNKDKYELKKAELCETTFSNLVPKKGYKIGHVYQYGKIVYRVGPYPIREILFYPENKARFLKFSHQMSKKLVNNYFFLSYEPFGLYQKDYPSFRAELYEYNRGKKAGESSFQGLSGSTHDVDDIDVVDSRDVRKGVYTAFVTPGFSLAGSMSLYPGTLVSTDSTGQVDTEGGANVSESKTATQVNVPTKTGRARPSLVLFGHNEKAFESHSEEDLVTTAPGHSFLYHVDTGRTSTTAYSYDYSKNPVDFEDSVRLFTGKMCGLMYYAVLPVNGFVVTKVFSDMQSLVKPHDNIKVKAVVSVPSINPRYTLVWYQTESLETKWSLYHLFDNKWTDLSHFALKLKMSNIAKYHLSQVYPDMFSPSLRPQAKVESVKTHLVPKLELAGHTPETQDPSTPSTSTSETLSLGSFFKSEESSEEDKFLMHGYPLGREHFKEKLGFKYDFFNFSQVDKIDQEDFIRKLNFYTESEDGYRLVLMDSPEYKVDRVTVNDKTVFELPGEAEESFDIVDARSTTVTNAPVTSAHVDNKATTGPVKCNKFDFDLAKDNHCTDMYSVHHEKHHGYEYTLVKVKEHNMLMHLVDGDRKVWTNNGHQVVFKFAFMPPEKPTMLFMVSYCLVGHMKYHLLFYKEHGEWKKHPYHHLADNSVYTYVDHTVDGSVNKADSADKVDPLVDLAYELAKTTDSLVTDTPSSLEYVPFASTTLDSSGDVANTAMDKVTVVDPTTTTDPVKCDKFDLDVASDHESNRFFSYRRSMYFHGHEYAVVRVRQHKLLNRVLDGNLLVWSQHGDHYATELGLLPPDRPKHVCLGEYHLHDHTVKYKFFYKSGGEWRHYHALSIVPESLLNVSKFMASGVSTVSVDVTDATPVDTTSPVTNTFGASNVFNTFGSTTSLLSEKFNTDTVKAVVLSPKDNPYKMNVVYTEGVYEKFASFLKVKGHWTPVGLSMSDNLTTRMRFLAAKLKSESVLFSGDYPYAVDVNTKELMYKFGTFVHDSIASSKWFTNYSPEEGHLVYLPINNFKVLRVSYGKHELFKYNLNTKKVTAVYLRKSEVKNEVISYKEVDRVTVFALDMEDKKFRESWKKEGNKWVMTHLSTDEMMKMMNNIKKAKEQVSKTEEKDKKELEPTTTFENFMDYTASESTVNRGNKFTLSGKVERKDGPLTVNAYFNYHIELNEMEVFVNSLKTEFFNYAVTDEWYNYNIVVVPEGYKPTVLRHLGNVVFDTNKPDSATVGTSNSADTDSANTVNDPVKSANTGNDDYFIKAVYLTPANNPYRVYLYLKNANGDSKYKYLWKNTVTVPITTENTTEFVTVSTRDEWLLSQMTETLLTYVKAKFANALDASESLKLTCYNYDLNVATNGRFAGNHTDESSFSTAISNSTLFGGSTDTVGYGGDTVLSTSSTGNVGTSSSSVFDGQFSGDPFVRKESGKSATSGCTSSCNSSVRGFTTYKELHKFDYYVNSDSLYADLSYKGMFSYIEEDFKVLVPYKDNKVSHVTFGVEKLFTLKSQFDTVKALLVTPPNNPRNLVVYYVDEECNDHYAAYTRMNPLVYYSNGTFGTMERLFKLGTNHKTCVADNGKNYTANTTTTDQSHRTFEGVKKQWFERPFFGSHLSAIKRIHTALEKYYKLYPHASGVSTVAAGYGEGVVAPVSGHRFGGDVTREGDGRWDTYCLELYVSGRFHDRKTLLVYDFFYYFDPENKSSIKLLFDDKIMDMPGVLNVVVREGKPSSFLFITPKIHAVPEVLMSSIVYGSQELLEVPDQQITLGILVSPLHDPRAILVHMKNVSGKDLYYYFVKKDYHWVTPDSDQYNFMKMKVMMESARTELSMSPSESLVTLRRKEAVSSGFDETMTLYQGLPEVNLFSTGMFLPEAKKLDVYMSGSLVNGESSLPFVYVYNQKKADRALVMEQGKMVEHKNVFSVYAEDTIHKTLFAMKPKYKQYKVRNFYVASEQLFEVGPEGTMNMVAWTPFADPRSVMVSVTTAKGEIRYNFYAKRGNRWEPSAEDSQLMNMVKEFEKSESESTEVAFSLDRVEKVNFDLYLTGLVEYDNFVYVFDRDRLDSLFVLKGEKLLLVRNAVEYKVNETINMLFVWPQLPKYVVTNVVSSSDVLLEVDRNSMVVALLLSPAYDPEVMAVHQKDASGSFYKYFMKKDGQWYLPKANPPEFYMLKRYMDLKMTERSGVDLVKCNKFDFDLAKDIHCTDMYSVHHEKHHGYEYTLVKVKEHNMLMHLVDGDRKVWTNNGHQVVFKFAFMPPEKPTMLFMVSYCLVGHMKYHLLFYKEHGEWKKHPYHHLADNSVYTYVDHTVDGSLNKADSADKVDPLVDLAYELAKTTDSLVTDTPSSLEYVPFASTTLDSSGDVANTAMDKVTVVDPTTTTDPVKCDKFDLDVASDHESNRFFSYRRSMYFHGHEYAVVRVRQHKLLNRVLDGNLLVWSQHGDHYATELGLLPPDRPKHVCLGEYHLHDHTVKYKFFYKSGGEWRHYHALSIVPESLLNVSKFMASGVSTVSVDVTVPVKSDMFTLNLSDENKTTDMYNFDVVNVESFKMGWGLVNNGYNLYSVLETVDSDKDQSEGPFDKSTRTVFKNTNNRQVLRFAYTPVNNPVAFGYSYVVDGETLQELYEKGPEGWSPMYTLSYMRKALLYLISDEYHDQYLKDNWQALAVKLTEKRPEDEAVASYAKKTVKEFADYVSTEPVEVPAKTSKHGEPVPVNEVVFDLHFDMLNDFYRYRYDEELTVVGNLTFNTCVPKEGVVVKDVGDTYMELYSLLSEETLKKISMYPREDPELLLLHLTYSDKSSDKHDIADYLSGNAPDTEVRNVVRKFVLVKGEKIQDNRWVLCEDKFDKKVEEYTNLLLMAALEEESEESPVSTVDLAKLMDLEGSDNYDVVRDSINDAVDVLTVYPRSRITKVVEGKNKVWVSGKSESLESLYMLPVDEPELLSILDSSNKISYFARHGGKWETVTEEAFYYISSYYSTSRHTLDLKYVTEYEQEMTPKDMQLVSNDHDMEAFDLQFSDEADAVVNQLLSPVTSSFGEVKKLFTAGNKDMSVKYTKTRYHEFLETGVLKINNREFGQVNPKEGVENNLMLLKHNNDVIHRFKDNEKLEQVNYHPFESPVMVSVVLRVEDEPSSTNPESGEDDDDIHIVDSRTTADNENSYTKILYLVRGAYRNERRWLQVDEEHYNTALELNEYSYNNGLGLMFGKEAYVVEHSVSRENEFKFELESASKTTNEYLLRRMSKSGHYYALVVNLGHRMTEVTDKGVTIFSAQEGQVIIDLYYSMEPGANNLTVKYVTEEGDDDYMEFAYMEKEGTTWVKKDTITVPLEISEIHEWELETKKGPVSFDFDIANYELTTEQTPKTGNKGCRVTRVKGIVEDILAMVNEGYRMVRLLDGDNLLYESPESYEIKSVLFTPPNDPKFLSMRYTDWDKNGLGFYSYFEKENGLWEQKRVIKVEESDSPLVHNLLSDDTASSEVYSVDQESMEDEYGEEPVEGTVGSSGLDKLDEKPVKTYFNPMGFGYKPVDSDATATTKSDKSSDRFDNLSRFDVTLVDGQEMVGTEAIVHGESQLRAFDDMKPFDFDLLNTKNKETDDYLLLLQRYPPFQMGLLSPKKNRRLMTLHEADKVVWKTPQDRVFRQMLFGPLDKPVFLGLGTDKGGKWNPLNMDYTFMQRLPEGTWRECRVPYINPNKNLPPCDPRYFRTLKLDVSGLVQMSLENRSVRKMGSGSGLGKSQYVVHADVLVNTVYDGETTVFTSPVMSVEAVKVYATSTDLFMALTTEFANNLTTHYYKSSLVGEDASGAMVELDPKGVPDDASVDEATVLVNVPVDNSKVVANVPENKVTKHGDFASPLEKYSVAYSLKNTGFVSGVPGNKATNNTAANTVPKANSNGTGNAPTFNNFDFRALLEDQELRSFDFDLSVEHHTNKNYKVRVTKCAHPAVMVEVKRSSVLERLYDGDLLLWKKSKQKHVKFMTKFAYLPPERPTHLCLGLYHLHDHKVKHTFYYKSGNVWHKYSPNEELDSGLVMAFNELGVSADDLSDGDVATDACATEPVKAAFDYDMSVENKSTQDYTVNVYLYHSTDTLAVVTPKPNGNLHAVLDGESTVWSNDGTKKFMVFAYLPATRPKHFALRFYVDNPTEYSDVYMDKYGGRWVPSYDPSNKFLDNALSPEDSVNPSSNGLVAHATPSTSSVESAQAFVTTATLKTEVQCGRFDFDLAKDIHCTDMYSVHHEKHHGYEYTLVKVKEHNMLMHLVDGDRKVWTNNGHQVVFKFAFMPPEKPTMLFMVSYCLVGHMKYHLLFYKEHGEWKKHPYHHLADNSVYTYVDHTVDGSLNKADSADKVDPLVDLASNLDLSHYSVNLLEKPTGSFIKYYVNFDDKALLEVDESSFLDTVYEGDNLVWRNHGNKKVKAMVYYPRNQPAHLVLSYFRDDEGLFFEYMEKVNGQWKHDLTPPKVRELLNSTLKKSNGLDTSEPAANAMVAPLKQGRKWTRIDTAEFYNKFMHVAVTGTYSKLDLSTQPDEGKYEVKDGFVYGKPIRVFNPLPGNHVYKITKGKTTVWSFLETNDHVKSVLAVYDKMEMGADPKLLQVYIKNRNRIRARFFKCKDNKHWVEVSEKQYANLYKLTMDKFYGAVTEDTTTEEEGEYEPGTYDEDEASTRATTDTEDPRAFIGEESPSLFKSQYNSLRDRLGDMAKDFKEFVESRLPNTTASKASEDSDQVATKTVVDTHQNTSEPKPHDTYHYVAPVEQLTVDADKATGEHGHPVNKFAAVQKGEPIKAYVVRNELPATEVKLGYDSRFYSHSSKNMTIYVPLDGDEVVKVKQGNYIFYSLEFATKKAVALTTVTHKGMVTKLIVSLENGDKMKHIGFMIIDNAWEDYQVEGRDLELLESEIEYARLKSTAYGFRHRYLRPLNAY